MKRMIVGYIPTKWYKHGWNRRYEKFSARVTARRAIYKDCSTKLELLLQQNRGHNREVAKSFNTEPSMATGRYNPLTKQL